eukprot:11185564-Lingulodinium_polyedra.AAC.1
MGAKLAQATPSCLKRRTRLASQKVASSETLAPSLGVLRGSVRLQPGLLVSVLSYNDAHFRLGRRELVAFTRGDARPRRWARGHERSTSSK